MLHDTFAAFGSVTNSHVLCDPNDGKSKGFGFVGFDSFEASDMAIAAMNGQYVTPPPPPLPPEDISSTVFFSSSKTYSLFILKHLLGSL